MISDLPRRWRREAAIADDLAIERAKEDRPDAAHRLQVAASTMRDCADELAEELSEPTHDQEGGTAHADTSPTPQAHHPHTPGCPGDSAGTCVDHRGK